MPNQWPAPPISREPSFPEATFETQTTGLYFLSEFSLVPGTVLAFFPLSGVFIPQAYYFHFLL